MVSAFQDRMNNLHRSVMGISYLGSAWNERAHFSRKAKSHPSTMSAAVLRCFLQGRFLWLLVLPSAKVRAHFVASPFPRCTSSPDFQYALITYWKRFNTIEAYFIILGLWSTTGKLFYTPRHLRFLNLCFFQNCTIKCRKIAKV